MAVSVRAFLVLLAAVGILRLWELGLSGHNQRRLLTLGARKISEPDFGWMLATHIGVLVGAALEVVLFHRPFVPMLATALRWWVIQTLGECWTVRVMSSVQFRVVAGGPFRFVRHPNYAAVFIKLLGSAPDSYGMADGSHGLDRACLGTLPEVGSGRARTDGK